MSWIGHLLWSKMAHNWLGFFSLLLLLFFKKSTVEVKARNELISSIMMNCFATQPKAPVHIYIYIWYLCICMYMICMYVYIYIFSSIPTNREPPQVWTLVSKPKPCISSPNTATWPPSSSHSPEIRTQTNTNDIPCSMESINRWNVCAAPLRPKGILRDSNNPNGAITAV